MTTLERDEDGVWVAECPSIPGCVSQGKSREEALDNIREAIVACLEVRAERGMPLTIETQQVRYRLMASLPAYSGKEVVRIFEKAGWQLARQRGSHMILVKAGSMVTLSVPDHREVAKGTLRSLIRSSGMTVQEFLALA